MLHYISIFVSKLNVSKYFCLIFLFFTINSCIKEDFNVKKIDVNNYNPGLAIPILNANLDLHDLASNNVSSWNLKEDSTKFMTLVYMRSESFVADSFLKFSDQQINSNYIFNVDKSLQVGDSLTDVYSSFLDFTSPDNDLLDLLFIKSGFLEVKINSDLNMRGKMVFTLPDVTKGGTMLVSQFTYTGKPIDLKIDLSGYLATFAHVGKLNRLSTQCDVTAYNDGLPNFSPYHVNLNITLHDIKFSKVYGYFSPRSFNFSDQVTIDLFDGVKNGESYFVNPKLNLYINNSVGIPMSLNINSFTAHSAIKAPYSINIIGIPNPINISSPVIPGSSVKSAYLLDTTNSNIKDAINLVPSYFKYDVVGITVPDVTQQNFIFDTSKIQLDVEIELPLYGRAKNYLLEDTMPFNIENLEIFESLTFNLLLSNGFPLESNVQIYFLDKNYKMLDSLFVLPRDALRSAITNNITGRVTQPTSHLYTVFFNRKRLDMITNCKNVKIRSILNTTNLGERLVKVYSNYTIDVKLSALAKLKI